MSKKTITPEAVPPEPSFVGDEHWGKGGSYIVVNGQRVPAPAEDAAPLPEQPAEKGE
jgi:hypothetical protein